jgi:hypothetical protein
MTDDQVFDAEYGYWYNAACERFYGRIDLACNFVQLVGGSAAAAAAFGGRPQLVVLSGLFLACAAAISLTVQPAVKADRHQRTKCAFLAIKRRRHSADAAAIDEAIADAQADGPVGIGALAIPAYNDAVRAMGREQGVRPLRWWERLAAFIA